MEELDLASAILASSVSAGSRASEPRVLSRMLVCVLPESLLQKSAVVNLNFFILTKFHEHDKIFYVKLVLDRSLNFIGIPETNMDSSTVS